MKKLISAVTSLCMAASMVCTVVPATVGAADASKGLSIKTYDIQNPDAASGKSEITINKKDIPAGGYTIPSAVYYSEDTNNSTGSLLASITTDSKDIQFKMYDPSKDAYTSENKSYKLGDVEFTTNKYISFGGYCKSARDGYKAAGLYQMACESSQTAAKTDNYFIGCSWMNNGKDYAWAGAKSDSYPLYAFDTIIPQNIAAGTYKVMFCDYNTDATGKNDNPCPMVESAGTRYTKKEGNLKLSELTIKVTDGNTDVTTTTKPDVTTTTTTIKTPDPTTTTTVKPVGDADITFEFVDFKTGKSSGTYKPGDTIEVDVNIKAGGKPVSATDVQFKANGLEVTEIGESAGAFDGVSVNSNLKELRASYPSLNGDTPMVPEDGKSAFMLTVKVPADAKDGVYTLDFDSQCKIFKDNTSFNYKTASTPLTVTVGTPVNQDTTTTTTVTTAKDPGKTTTTTVKPVGDADITFDFVDYKTQKTAISAKAGDEIEVDVNIKANGKPVSATDVQFKATNGLVLSDIGESAGAFDGVSVNSNLKELRASYPSLNGDTPMVPEDGKSAFMLTVKVPANAKDGDVYTLGFDSQCKIFKDNTSFNYKTDFTPLTITIGDGVVSTISTTAVTTTTVTTTVKPDPTTSTTTTTTPDPQPGKTIKVTMWGDANCDGKVNVADVVAIRNMTADMDAFLADAGFAFDKAQGRVNADVVDPQDITGAACDPAKVKITGADADLIINYIISNGYDMAKAVTPKKS
ncbi:hypothetical protein [Ruminococcus flavefaciens]|uniref:hypothetical protein n=1 Tax=Ruminococcus flavefaciens TaxID=1265 RepID=UPI0026F0B50B|nr:hypothetical protein [Ruminococcus flavefaciens]